MKPWAGSGWIGLLAVALTAVLGCGRADTSDGSPEPGARTYQVRGILQALPDLATGTGQLRIRHEAISDLIGASGEVEGMEAMTMSFPVADEVDLEGFAAGDRVRFDLQVDWDAALPVVIQKLDRLPPETELELD